MNAANVRPAHPYPAEVLAEGLSAQVARLAEIDAQTLERMRHEVLTIPHGWVAEYGDYQSGGWWTLSLLNDTGEPADVTIRDCQPRPTGLLERMPVTARLLEGLGLEYMWVRLARLRANSFLWEHRDYAELAETERFRLHIPLATNSSAVLVAGGARVHLAAGHIWRLTPSVAHGVCNLLGPDRIHLIADCYASPALQALTDSAHLEPGDALALPAATRVEIDEHLGVARTLVGLGYTHAAESHLLRLFYAYDLPEGYVYDLIARLYESLQRADAAAAWRSKKTVMLALA